MPATSAVITIVAALSEVRYDLIHSRLMFDVRGLTVKVEKLQTTNQKLRTI